MYNMPFAPHEIDALPIGERIRATIREAEGNTEIGFEETLDEKNEEIDDLECSVGDLHEELSDLVDAIESDDPARTEQAIIFAKNALKRNKS